MKKLFIIIATFASVLSASCPLLAAVGSKDPSYLRACPVELRGIVDRLRSLPEARALMEKANRRGNVAVAWHKEKTASFNGLWNGTERTIYVNQSNGRQTGDLIQTLIFELHNAAGSDYLEELWDKARAGTIDKESFIANLERWEHEHVVKAAAMIDKGIERGLFPLMATLGASSDFHSHYMIQQLAGHSQWYSKHYDECSPNKVKQPYRGTITNLDKLTVDDKRDLNRYLSWRMQIVDAPHPNIARSQRQKALSEYNDLQACLSGKSNQNAALCKRAEVKMQLFQDVFRGLMDFPSKGA